MNMKRFRTRPLDENDLNNGHVSNEEYDEIDQDFEKDHGKHKNSRKEHFERRFAPNYRLPGHEEDGDRFITRFDMKIKRWIDDQVGQIPANLLPGVKVVNIKVLYYYDHMFT